MKIFNVFFSNISSLWLYGPFAYCPSAIPPNTHSNEFHIFGVSSPTGNSGIMDAGQK